MKRNFLFSLCVLLLVFSGDYMNAQPTWLGAKRGSPEFPQDMAIDNNGNTYIAWSVRSSACNVDGHVIETHGSMDYSDWAVTSFTCDGTYRWTKVIGGNMGDAIVSIGTDTLGGLYILGNVNSDSTNLIYVDDDTTVHYTKKVVLLIKYDTSGNFKWLTMPEPEASFAPGAVYSMATEPNGTLHILSLLKPATYCNGAFTANSPDSANTYILKYNKEGHFLSGIHLDISNNSNTIRPYTSSAEITYDPLYKRYYLCGMRLYNTHISFGGTPVSGQNFLTAFDSTGSVVWIKQSDNDDAQTSLSGKPAIDPMGNIYVTGYSYNGLDGAPNDSYGSIGFNNTLGVYGFPILVKFNPGGVVQYATNASDNTDNTGSYITVDNGEVAVLGLYGGKLKWGDLEVENTIAANELVNVFLARFNSETGAIIGLDTIRSSDAYDYPRFLRADHKGNLYAGGQFGGTLYVSDNVLTKNDGNYDAFVAGFGYDHCNCETPEASFNYVLKNNDTVEFTYTGSTADSVRWYFGDGHSETGNIVNHYLPGSGNSISVCAVSYNSCGSDMACTGIAGNNNTALLEPNKSGAVTLLYPNPATDYIIITGDLSGMASIVDFSGRCLSTQDLPKSGRVNILGLSPGLYFVRIATGDGQTITRKFSVK